MADSKVDEPSVQRTEVIGVASTCMLWQVQQHCMKTPCAILGLQKSSEFVQLCWAQFQVGWQQQVTAKTFNDGVDPMHAAVCGLPRSRQVVLHSVVGSVHLARCFM